MEEETSHGSPRGHEDEEMLSREGIGGGGVALTAV